MKNISNIIILLSFSILVSFLINLTFLDLSIKNLNKSILFPSSTSIEIFEKHDIDDNFQWVRRSNESNSIFKLSANINEDKERYHFQSSRGLSYFLAGISLYLTNNSLYAISITKIIFTIISTLLFFIIGKFYFKNYISIFTLILLTFLFSNKLFGGVLNFNHFFEYFHNLKSFYISNSIDRIPNILISNVFVLLNFYIFKSYFISQKKIYLGLIFLLILISIFITPIIFIVYSGTLFLTSLLIYKEHKNLTFLIYNNLILLIIFSIGLLFHFKNLGEINDGSLNSPQWTGNYLYDLEIFFGPLILIIVFFTKQIKKFYLEIIFFSIQLVFYVLSFFYDVYLASKINENFIFLNSFLTFILISKVICLDIKSINKKFVSILILIYLLYLNLVNGFTLNILFLFLFILSSSAIAIYLKNSQLAKYGFALIVFIIFTNFNLYEFSNNQKKFNYTTDRESDQIELIGFLNDKKISKKTILSLDLGVIKNLSIHTHHNIYLGNITNSNLSINQMKKRFFDIIYLYGFTYKDIEEYLYDFKQHNTIDSQLLISAEDMNKNNNRFTLNFYKYFYHIQNITTEIETTKFIEEYNKYLISKKFENLNYFDACLISKYDQTLVKNNSMIYNISKTKPIFRNKNFSLFRCN